MERLFLMFLDHTRRSTVGSTPLDEWSARRRDLYLTTHDTTDKYPCPRWDSNPRSQQASGRRTPLDEWSARRRDLYLTTHNTHKRQNIHAPGGIRTQDLSRWAAAGLWPLTCWDGGFESHQGHGYLSVMSVVCCQVEVSATSWSLIQRSPTDCAASLCVV